MDFLEFESPLPHNKTAVKPVTTAGFNFTSKKSVTSMSVLYHFKMPRLVKAKHGWYIVYYYRVPPELRHMYIKEWQRFRGTEDINRRTGVEREQYALVILDELTESLKKGFNPFDTVVSIVKSSQEQAPEVITCKEAFKQFLDVWKKRGLEEQSYAKYKKCVNRLAAYLHNQNILYNDINEIKTTHIEAFLDDGRKTYKFSNREYNNTFDFIRTCFNYLVKKEIIKKSPCAGIDKLKTASTKHRFYDTETLKSITKALLAADPYTYLAVQTVYYLCIRSDKELMNFKVSNILWDQNKILLDAKGTKGNSARYVPMDENIKALFIKHGVNKYPGEYYVFGIKGKPSSIPFGTGFFAKRFRKVRDAAGLSTTFTPYSFKHTRVIHLKQDGVDDASIMSLTGHKDFVSYAHYLRDLGLDANPEKINKVSRKI